MSVNLAVGMTAIRRDGERKGPFIDNKDGTFHVKVGAGDDPGNVWYADGSPWGGAIPIIAAGFPWATLGAQVGDTVRRVWNGYAEMADDCEFVVRIGHLCVSHLFHPDSLYVIVKPAAKPADRPSWFFEAWDIDRPRAAHKLDLRDGDVVELMGWQDGEDFRVGDCFEWRDGYLETLDGGEFESDFEGKFLTNYDKGHRPLFRVIPRAAEQKPDEVIVRYGENCPRASITIGRDANCTHRFTLTFPHGSDTGTVVREAL